MNTLSAIQNQSFKPASQGTGTGSVNSEPSSMLTGMPTQDSLTTMLEDSAKFSAEAKLAAAQNTCNQLQNMVFALAMQQMLAKGQNVANGNVAAAGNGNAAAAAGNGNAAANAAGENGNAKADTTTLKNAAIDQIGKKMATFKHGLGTTTSGDEMSKTGKGDCWAGADYLKKELEQSGYQARIIEYPTSQANNHRSVQLQINGQWVDFPYKQYGIDKNFGSYQKGSFKVLEK
ncbi:MAG: hypothetical protein AB9903_18175 [Vulcanimicrobiota bacterium]